MHSQLYANSKGTFGKPGAQRRIRRIPQAISFPLMLCCALDSWKETCCDQSVDFRKQRARAEKEVIRIPLTILLIGPIGRKWSWTRRRPEGYESGVGPSISKIRQSGDSAGEFIQAHKDPKDPPYRSPRASFGELIAIPCSVSSRVGRPRV